jgi:hypothetical protein
VLLSGRCKVPAYVPWCRANLQECRPRKFAHAVSRGGRGGVGAMMQGPMLPKQAKDIVSAHTLRCPSFVHAFLLITLALIPRTSNTHVPTCMPPPPCGCRSTRW